MLNSPIYFTCQNTKQRGWGKILGASKPKSLNRIAKIGYAHLREENLIF